MTRPRYNYETWPPEGRHMTYACHLDDCGTVLTHEHVLQLCEDYADHVRDDHGRRRPNVRDVRQGVLRYRQIHPGPAPARADIWAGHRRRRPDGDPGAAEAVAEQQHEILAELATLILEHTQGYLTGAEADRLTRALADQDLPRLACVLHRVLTDYGRDATTGYVTRGSDEVLARISLLKLRGSAAAAQITGVRTGDRHTCPACPAEGQR